MYLFRKFTAVLMVVLSLTLGVVTQPSYASNENGNAQVKDPLEPLNRLIFSFNMFLDRIFIKPVAKMYRFVVPEIGRKGVRNVLVNLTEPVTLVNSVLQGDAENSFSTFWRFSINSTIGIGGLFDVAKYGGLEHRAEDLGQTFGKYGAGSGYYLMLPLMGPSNTRDLVGTVGDSFMDPYNYLVDGYGVAGRTVLTGLDSREQLIELIDDIQESSLDPYATFRSLYTQRRSDEIKNGSKQLK